MVGSEMILEHLHSEDIKRTTRIKKYFYSCGIEDLKAISIEIMQLFYHAIRTLSQTNTDIQVLLVHELAKHAENLPSHFSVNANNKRAVIFDLIKAVNLMIATNETLKAVSDTDIRTVKIKFGGFINKYNFFSSLDCAETNINLSERSVIQ